MKCFQSLCILILIAIFVLNYTSLGVPHSQLVVLKGESGGVPFEEDLVRFYSFPETDESYTPDSSSYEINGDINKDTPNEPEWAGSAASKISVGSYFFNGTSDYIGIYTNILAQSSPSEGTFSCWIRIDQDTEQFLLGSEYGSATALAFSIENLKVAVSGSYNAEGLTFWKVESDTVLSTGTWYQVGFTADSSDYKIFVNGTNTSLTVSAANPGFWFDKWAPHPSEVWIGDVVLGRRRDNLKWLDGYFATVKFYGRALSTGEYYEAYSYELDELQPLE